MANCMAKDVFPVLLDGDDPHDVILAPELVHINKMNVNVLTREIFVADEIGEEFGSWFTCVMAYLESLNTAPVTIWLNTPGGDENSMFTFHDIVRASMCHVRVIGVGQVCSAGVLMLACGHERLVTENCVLMSHRGKGGVEGDLETMEARMKYVKWAEQQWGRLMARYTPESVDGQLRDEKYWFQLGKKRSEWWVFGGAAIVKEGIADAIYPNVRKS